MVYADSAARDKCDKNQTAIGRLMLVTATRNRLSTLP